MIFRAFTFGVAATVGMALGIWTIDRDLPVVVTKVEVEGPVPPGGNLRIHYWVRRYRDCAYKIDRSMHDRNRVRVVLQDLEFARPPGPLGDDNYVSEVPVPESFSQGPAIYRTILTYKCNLIHEWFWPIIFGPNDINFEVQGPAPILPVPPELRQPTRPLQ